MSLKGIHLLFVTLATALSLWFGTWSLFFQPEGSNGQLVTLGILSYIIAAALTAYEIWFLTRMRRWSGEDASKKTLQFGTRTDRRDGRD